MVMSRSLPTMVRFGIVALIGLAVDLSVARTLAWTGIALPLAAAGGFAVGAAVNYALHEGWTFRSGRAGGLSARRAGAYLGTLLIVLAVRVATVAALERLAPELPDMGILVAGVSLSFCVNWALSRHFVFRSRT